MSTDSAQLYSDWRAQTAPHSLPLLEAVSRLCSWCGTGKTAAGTLQTYTYQAGRGLCPKCCLGSTVLADAWRFPPPWDCPLGHPNCPMPQGSPARAATLIAPCFLTLGAFYQVMFLLRQNSEVVKHAGLMPHCQLPGPHLLPTSPEGWQLKLGSMLHPYSRDNTAREPPSCVVVRVSEYVCVFSTIVPSTNKKAT